MTDWTIFARGGDVAPAREFDVLWEGSALLLEGSSADPFDDVEALDDVFDARFAGLDKTASRLAEAAGRNCAALHGDALALRYELVRLLRVATYFSTVRPLARGALLTFYHDRRRDADYVALLETIAEASDATVRLGSSSENAASETVYKESREAAYRVDAAHERPSPRAPFFRQATSDVAAWRRWAGRANAAFDAGLNFLAREQRAPVMLLGRPEILDGVCGELLARGERVVWLWEHFHAGVYRRWRRSGVQLVALDDGSREAAPTTRTKQSRSPLVDVEGCDLTVRGPFRKRIDLGPAIVAWAKTRRESFDRRARLAQRLFELFSRCVPKAVVVDEDATPLKRAAITAAREHGAPSFVVQHGAPGVRFGFSPHLADVVLAWGESSRRRFLAWGVPDEALEVVGYPRRDDWSKQKTHSGAPRTSKPVREAPTLLVLASPTPRDERPDALAFPLTAAAHREMWSHLFRLLAARPAGRTIVKLHPREPAPTSLAALAASFGARVEWTHAGDASDYFDEADVVISLASSAGLEAAACGLPVVSLVPSRSSELYSPKDWGLIAEVRSFAGLQAAVEVALDRGRLSGEPLQALRAQAFQGLDGRAAQRVVVVVVERTSKHAADAA